jgi:hypothetical protein
MMVLQACCHPSLISHLADQDLKSSHCLNPMCDNKIGFYSDLALCGGRDPHPNSQVREWSDCAK